jgi:uncharacterized membrane protein YdjX (TVP38/TMEM64 family)
VTTEKSGEQHTAGSSGSAETADLARRLGPAGILGIVWTFLPAVCGTTLLVYADTVGAWLRAHEANGPVIYAGGFIVLSGLGILPTYASAILGGWAFGFAVGFPAALAGFVGGSLLGYGIARKASGDRVKRIIAEKPTWRAVHDALVGGSYAKTLGIITLLRVPPNSPFALTNLVLASVKVPLSAYVVGTLVGMAPRTAVVLYIATLFRDMSAKEAAKQTPWWYYAIMIGASLVVLLVIGMIAKAALARVTGGQRAGAADVGEA